MENKEISKKQGYLKNILFGGIMAVVSKIGSLIFAIILARIFLPAEFGAYFFVLSIILSLIFFTELGTNSTLTRFLSESIGKNNETEARSRFWFIFKVRLILSLSVSLILFFGSDLIAIFFKKPELTPLFQLGAIFLFLNTFYNLATSIFLSVQKVQYNLYLETIFQVSRLIFIFFIIYFYKSIKVIFIGMIPSVVIIILISFFIILSKYRYILIGKKISVPRKRMIKFSWFVSLNSITGLIFGNVDKLILGYFLSLEFLGFYAAILGVIGGVIGIIVLGSIFLPSFTQANEEELKPMFKKYLHYNSILSFPSAIGLAFIILPLLKFLYGGEYVPQRYELELLITSVLFSLLIIENSFSSMYITLFNSREKPQIPAKIMIVSALLNLILSFILIIPSIKINPSYGLVGAAASIFISRYLALFFLMWYSKKYEQITPLRQTLTKPLFASMIMLIFLFVYKSLFDLTLLSGIIMILLAIIVYFITIFLTKALTIGELTNLLHRLKLKE